MMVVSFTKLHSDILIDITEMKNYLFAHFYM